MDRSVDYGEYTFDSRDFDERRDGVRLAAVAGWLIRIGDAAPGGRRSPERPTSQRPAGGASRPSRAAAETVVFAGGRRAGTPARPSAVRAPHRRTNNRTYDLASARLLMGGESRTTLRCPT